MWAYLSAHDSLCFCVQKHLRIQKVPFDYMSAEMFPLVQYTTPLTINTTIVLGEDAGEKGKPAV